MSLTYACRQDAISRASEPISNKSLFIIASIMATDSYYVNATVISLQGFIVKP